MPGGTVQEQERNASNLPFRLQLRTRPGRYNPGCIFLERKPRSQVAHAATQRKENARLRMEYYCGVSLESQHSGSGIPKFSHRSTDGQKNVTNQKCHVECLNEGTNDPINKCSPSKSQFIQPIDQKKRKRKRVFPILPISIFVPHFDSARYSA